MTRSTSAPHETVRFYASNGNAHGGSNTGPNGVDRTEERPRRWQNEPTEPAPSQPSQPSQPMGAEWTAERRADWAAAFNRLLVRAAYAVAWQDGRLGYHWGPLAEKTNLTINQLNAYARKGSRPVPAALTRLARALGVSPWLLMRYAGYVDARQVGEWLLHGDIPDPDALSATLDAIREDMPDTAFRRNILAGMTTSAGYLAWLRDAFALTPNDFGVLAVDRLRAELREQTAPHRAAQRIDTDAPTVQPGPTLLSPDDATHPPVYDGDETDESE